VTKFVEKVLKPDATRLDACFAPVQNAANSVHQAVKQRRLPPHPE